MQARFVRQEAAQREVIGTFRPTVTEKANSKETELVFDLGFARPHDRIDFVVSPAVLFSRAAFVSVSSDGKQWGSAGSANLERTATRESLSAQLPESWERYVRVTISNYDNAPVPVTKAVFYAVRRELIFSAPEAGDYWLYAGNANAAAASYDLGSILPAEASLLPVSAGAVQANPDYVAPQKPWPERSSLPLTILLIILVPLVATVAFRMLRRVEA